MNEVDVARVRIGQRATLTFDAIEGLQITGTIAEIDTLGTVTQGVVTYDVVIAFDTQDERVKSGMSVASAIITDVRTDAVVIPSAAVKSAGDSAYVEVPREVLDAAAVRDPSGVPLASIPERRSVTVGLTNDTTSEVVDGVREGEFVIVRTVTPAAASAAQAQQRSILQFGGAGARTFGGGGGTPRPGTSGR